VFGALLNPPPENQLVDLPWGKTFFRLSGPSDGPLIVFVHGISTPSQVVWYNTLSYLNELGYRTLSYDLYGRGWSSAPGRVSYTADFFVSQLVHLLYKLNITSSFDLVGLSMGGAISATFTDKFPERVNRLVLIASAGLPLPTMSPILRVLPRLPIFGHLLQTPIIAKHLLKSQVKEEFAVLDGLQYVESVLTQVADVQIDQNPDYIKSLAETLRSFDLEGFENVFRRLGQHNRTVLLLWGEKDYTVPLSCGKLINGMLPRSKLVTHPSANHLLPMLHSEWLQEQLHSFFSEK
jgi:pimeloyl-ACP methyl ester carboxylesterase